MVITGLEAIGKSVVVDTALKQNHARTLRIPCTEGTSADYLYEYLLKAVGRVPTGTSPRDSFSTEDMRDALRGVEILWLEDCHTLLQYGRWRTKAIEQLVERLMAAAQKSSTCILFESRRSLSLDPPLGVQVRRRRFHGLPSRDGIAFFEQQLRRADVSLDVVSSEQRAQIVQLVDGHPGMLVLCADVCAKKDASFVINDLKGRRGFYWTSIKRLVRELRLSTNEKKCLEALGLCQAPIEATVLKSIVPAPEYLDCIESLAAACLVESGSQVNVRLVPLLRNLPPRDNLSDDESRAFHSAASDYYLGESQTLDDPLGAYHAAVAANYHASLAGKKAPCKLSGIMDGVASAARKVYETEKYEKVVRMLAGLPESSLPEDLLAILAESYAWTDNFPACFRLADEIVQKNRNYVSIFTDACQAAIRSRNWEQAKVAIQRAESLEPGYYRVYLYRGRIAEHERRFDKAIEFYKRAVETTERDAWPFFYLTRAYIRQGLPELALDTAEAGKEMVEGLSKRAFEQALLSQEAIALLLTGREEAASYTLSTLEKVEDARPEIVVCAAYMRAYLESNQPGQRETLGAFDAALSRLSEEDSRKAHTKAQICLFRGKLLQQMGDLKRAEAEFSRACDLDKFNVHMKVCLMEVLKQIAHGASKRNDSEAAKSAAQSASETASAILKYDRENVNALNTLETMYREFGVASHAK